MAEEGLEGLDERLALVECFVVAPQLEVHAPGEGAGEGVVAGQEGAYALEDAALPARHAKADFRPAYRPEGVPGQPHIEVGRRATGDRVAGCGQRAGHPFQAPASPWAQRRAGEIRP